MWRARLVIFSRNPLLPASRRSREFEETERHWQQRSLASEEQAAFALLYEIYRPNKSKCNTKCTGRRRGFRCSAEEGSLSLIPFGSAQRINMIFFILRPWEYCVDHDED
jgi:hypothetical protein